MTYMSSSEVAACIGVKVNQVLKLARAGRIPSVIDGKKVRFPRAAWEKFMEDQSAAALASVRQAKDAHTNCPQSQ